MSEEIVQLLVYQLDDFQELISDSSDNFSKTKFYQTLQEITKKKFAFSNAEIEADVEWPFTSIRQLKSLASSMKNGRRRFLFTADELTVINQHLNYLEYILELKSYFDERIFAFILKITSQWQTTIKKSRMSGRNRKFIEGEFTKVNGCSKTTPESVQKSKMVQRKLKCLGDELTELNGCSLTENDVKELADSVDQIKAIESRWSDMIDCSKLNLSFFEEETKGDILTKNKESSFELICYVVPDQLKKIEKCIELSRKWLKAALPRHNNQNTSPALYSTCDSPKQYIMPWGSIVPGQYLPNKLITDTGNFSSLPTRTRVGPHVKPVLCQITRPVEKNKSFTFIGMDSRRRIIETWMKILEVDERILADEKRARRLRMELKRLANKENRYAILKSDYETTAGKLRQACTDYRNALLERHSLNRKIWKEPGFSEEVKAMSKLYEVGDRIESSQKDMKMLKYSFALLQEDMALEASMRSSYIRFEENVKERLFKLGMQIEEKKQKKRKLDKEMVLLKANSKWFESKYGKGELSEVEDWKERSNNERYTFKQTNGSVEGEITLDKPQWRAAIGRHRKTEDQTLSCNSERHLIFTDSPISTDSDCASQDTAVRCVGSPSSSEISSPAQASTGNRGYHRRCGRNRSIARVDRVFDGLPFISIDIESEPDGMSCNQKLAGPEENGRVSRIPILRDSSGFPKTSRCTEHAQSKIKPPASRNPMQRAGGNNNQRGTRIPKLIH